MSNETPKIEWVHCNECSQKTKHSLVASRKNIVSEDVQPDYHLTWTTVYDMLQCCGCESVTLRCKQDFSEDNPQDQRTIYYPPRASRRLPEWYYELPSEMVELLKEVYTALHADSRRIAMMGARALIDMLMIDRIGDVGSFPEKLKKMVEDGFISYKNSEVLEAALDVGNAASHRGHKPKAAHVQQVMDIVENLIQTYVLEPMAQQLKAATPKRPRKKKAKKKK